MQSRYILAISGASGAFYAKKVFDLLHRMNAEIHLIISSNGVAILQEETGITPSYFEGRGIHIYKNSDINASIASGTFKCGGMVVIPCSMGTLGRIATGISNDLISRSADVTLKERRRLILVPRETPINEIHIRNMLTLSQAGAIILPASPGFYHNPRSIDDIADFIAAKVLDHLNIDNDLLPCWGKKKESG